MTRHRRKDGTIYDAEVSGYPIQLNGHLVLYNSTRDITERKLLEAKLIASSNEIQDLYNHAPCGYHSLDSEGTIIRINDTELQWLGYERDEVLGKMKITDFLTDSGKDQFRKIYPDFLKYGHIENLEFDLVSKNGNLRTVSVNASTIRDDENQFIMSRTVLYDITELKKNQDELKQLTDEQQAMLDNELVGIVKLRDRRIVWINSAATHIFGYEREELKGQLTSVLYPDDAAFKAFGGASYPILNSGAPYRAQIELVRKDNEKIWLDMSGQKLSANNNESLWMMLDITHIKKHQHEVEEIAYHDILTGLPNRLLVENRLKQALTQAKRANQLLAVCYLDLDDFKPVNDQYGHAAGDELLIELARRMQKLVRANDTMGRFGGDEFVLLLTNLETVNDYHLVLNRVIDEINAPFLIDNSSKISVGVSIGVALYPNDSDDADILLRHSDQAMYQAKKLGRNRICQYSDK